MRIMTEVREINITSDKHSFMEKRIEVELNRSSRVIIPDITIEAYELPGKNHPGMKLLDVVLILRKLQQQGKRI